MRKLGNIICENIGFKSFLVKLINIFICVSMVLKYLFCFMLGGILL